MRKIIIALVVLLVVLTGVFLLGPKPAPFSMDAIVSKENPKGLDSLVEINSYLESLDIDKQIRKGNYSQILWADSTNQKTKYVLLYLHGFSASPVEGAPIHESIAVKYGMNMYVPRLAEHGLDEKESMLNFTGEKYIQSAKEAVQVARLLGDSVIIMSTSTGGTAALYIASEDNNIHSLISYSPNIRLFDSKAPLLNGPWGLQIARFVKGNNYHEWNLVKEAHPYWHTKYRLEALVQLQNMIMGTMKMEVFEKITAPSFVGYYYKNELEQDSVVSVDAIVDMNVQLGSKVKRIEAFPDAMKHCMPSGFEGQDLESLFKSTCQFMEEDLGILPILRKK
jgi:esterase/lipase